MNRIDRTDIRKFLGMTETYGRDISYYKKVEDPSYITFTLKFNFGKQSTDDVGYYITNGNLLTDPVDQPLDTKDNKSMMRVNSAYEYLLAVNRPKNARMLLEFINQLKDIQNNRPWTFQKLDGLDSCFKFDRTKIWQRKDAKIDVECLEYFDKQLLLLQTLYHNAVYDTEFNRFLLPKNFAGFGCDIIISEFNEKFEMTTEPPNLSTIIDASVETFLNKNPFLRDTLSTLPLAGELIGGIIPSTWKDGIKDFANSLWNSTYNSETVQNFMRKTTSLKSSKNKTYEEWLEEEYQMEESKRTGIGPLGKRPFSDAKDKEIRQRALEKYNEAQNSTSVNDIVDTVLNSSSSVYLQKYIGDEGVNDLLNTMRSIYSKAVRKYLNSIRDYFTYTVIHCEKCSFDFNPGFESYKSISASQIGEQVKSKFSILPKKVVVSHDFGIHEWVLSEWVEDLVTPPVYGSKRDKSEYTAYLYPSNRPMREKNSVKEETITEKPSPTLSDEDVV